MTAPSLRRTRLLVALACASLALTGCAPEPSASPAPAVTSSASPSATADALPAPGPVLSLACEDIVPSGLGAGLLTERLSPLSASVDRHDPDLVRPDDFATQQAGGITCSTSNGDRQTDNGIANLAFVGIDARILPDAATQFAVLADFAGSPRATSDHVVSCGDGPPDYCYLDLLVGSTWVALAFWGIDPSLPRGEDGAPAQVAELATGIREIVEGLTASGARWNPPTDTAPIAYDCAVFFGPERIQADFGTTETVYLDPYEDYISAERTAREVAPALACPWHTDYLEVFGAHHTLGGGEWAFRQLENAGEFDGYEQLDLDGLGENDLALISCSAVAGRCVADAVVARNWIQFAVPFGPEGPDQQTAESKVASLMQTAVDTVLA